MCIRITQGNAILASGSPGIIKTKTGQNKLLSWGIPGNYSPRLHARIETIHNKWLIYGYEVGTIEIESFQEKEIEFVFNKPTNIGIIYKEDHFLVVTESADLQIAKVHHRQPCHRELKTLLAS